MYQLQQQTTINYTHMAKLFLFILCQSHVKPLKCFIMYRITCMCSFFFNFFFIFCILMFHFFFFFYYKQTIKSKQQEKKASEDKKTARGQKQIQGSELGDFRWPRDIGDLGIRQGSSSTTTQTCFASMDINKMHCTSGTWSDATCTNTLQ